MAFTVVKVTINPTTAKVYTHNLSPTEMTIEIVGENTAVVVRRGRALIPDTLRNLIPDVTTPEVEAVV